MSPQEPEPIIVSSIFDIGIISTAVPEKNASSLSSKSS